MTTLIGGKISGLSLVIIFLLAKTVRGSNEEETELEGTVFVQHIFCLVQINIPMVVACLVG